MNIIQQALSFPSQVMMLVIHSILSTMNWLFGCRVVPDGSPDPTGDDIADDTTGADIADTVGDRRVSGPR